MRAARPIRSHSPRDEDAETKISASASASPGGNVLPVSPSTIASGIPDSCEPAAGVPAAIASRITSGMHSYAVEGMARTSIAA